MEEVQLTSEKLFQIELSSDKNNSYSIEFILNSYIEIIANQINNKINRSYSNKYSFEDIRETKYFLQFNTFSEILDEIKVRIEENKIIINENENKLILNIPLQNNQEIIFELNPIIKNNNDRLNELTDLIIKLNTEINNVKNENKQLNEENKQTKTEINNMKNNEVLLMKSNEQMINNINLLKNENTQLKNEVSKLKNDNIQLKNYINQIKNEIIQLKNDNNQLKNNESQSRNENAQLIKELNELKEKLNVLVCSEERIRIKNLNGKIINGNKTYNETLKYWINPLKKIKAELLYRLSEHRDNISKFHELCDNKGPTLTLFHVNDGNIVGIYTPLSLDSSFK